MNLTSEEKQRLKELISLKKQGKLSDSDKKELEELNKRCGFKGSAGGKRGEKFKPGNDFSWWNKNPELTKDCTNFKCNYIAGLPIDEGKINYVVPGVLSVVLASVYGINLKPTDPINVWARDLYLDMFQRYRAPSGYSASDLGITVLAVLEIVKAVAFYERIYGVINRYDLLNVNMPETEAKSLGLAPETVRYLQGHLADFRLDLNFLIRKAQKIKCPKDIAEILDAISLFGYEYKDHDSSRAQIINFIPDSFGQYSDNNLTSGGSIQFSTLENLNLFDFGAENMCYALAEMVDALVGSDSAQHIIADLKVWYGEEQMLGFVPIPEDYVIYPVYNEPMLHKLHNLETPSDPFALMGAVAHPSLSADDRHTVLNGNYWVYQANDVIVTAAEIIPNYSATEAVVTGGKYNGYYARFVGTDIVGMTNAHMIDTYHEEVTPETILEGAMYKADLEIKASGDNKCQVVNTASFYVAMKVKLYTADDDMMLMTNVTSNSSAFNEYVANLSVVDWAPLVYLTYDNVTVDKVGGDVDNVIPISRGQLSKIHRTAILSGLKTDCTVVAK